MIKERMHGHALDCGWTDWHGECTCGYMEAVNEAMVRAFVAGWEDRPFHVHYIDKKHEHDNAESAAREWIRREASK